MSQAGGLVKQHTWASGELNLGCKASGTGFWNEGEEERKAVTGEKSSAVQVGKGLGSMRCTSVCGGLRWRRVIEPQQEAFRAARCTATARGTIGGLGCYQVLFDVGGTGQCVWCRAGKRQ